jgi:4-amino-4-deoxy-L-arabinose transferase-like glycosyltransferase
LYHLTGQSLWLDEVVTAQSAHLNTLAEVVDQSHVYVNQMPLYYIFTWLLRPWGDGEFILRLPSAVAGTLTVLAVYLLGRRLYGTRMGLASSLVFALLPYGVWSSQEARNYALFMLLTTMQMYFAFTAIKRGRVIDWLGLALFTTLNLYTHYVAFLPTAAIVVYISGWLLVEVLGSASNRRRIATVSALVLLAVVAVLVPWRQVLRGAYVGARNALILTRLHSGIALTLTAVLVAIVVVVGVLLRKRLEAAFGRMPAVTKRLALAAGAAAMVAIAYAPWLPSLRVAISRPDVTIGTIHLGRTPGLGDVLGVLERLGFSGFMLAALCIGLIAGVAWSFRGRAAESTLLLSWLGVPLFLLLRAAGPSLVAINLRYVAFLIPAAMLVIGVAIEVGARGVAWLVRRCWPRAWSEVPFLAVVASLPVVALLLVQVLPALAASYQVPKEDWRGAAEHISASSPPGSVVIAVGNYYTWSLLCFDYYFKRLHSSSAVVDGLQVNSEVAANLANSNAKVWGVIIFPSDAQLAWLKGPGEEKIDFVDVTGHIYLVEAADQGLSTIAQARTLLRWEMQLQPELSASVKLLDLFSGHAQLGPNLVPDPTVATSAAKWSFDSGTRPDPNGVAFTPSAAAPELNATFTTALDSGEDYAVSFEWLNPFLNGSQRVYVMAVDRLGHPIYVFPSGSGYACGHSNSWTRSYFAFSVPPGTYVVSLILRVSGSGTAVFRNVQMSHIADVL